MGSFFAGAVGLFAVLGMLALGLVQIAAGWAGIEHAFGFWWGIGAVAAAMLVRFTLPLSYGVYVCAHDIWGWHWAAALAVALPGLLFMVPGLVAAATAAVRKR